MPKQTPNTKKLKNAGIGSCGNPHCEKPKMEGRYVCKDHAKEYSRIRKEFEEDPMLLYNQRGGGGKIMQERDPKTGEIKKTRRPRTPVCCVPGCWELRVPPAAYCFAHENTGGSD